MSILKNTNDNSLFVKHGKLFKFFVDITDRNLQMHNSYSYNMSDDIILKYYNYSFDQIN